MSLRYLDINPTPVSEEGIYGIEKTIQTEELSVTYKYLLNRAESYLNDVYQGSEDFQILSEGCYNVGFTQGCLFYNSEISKYMSFLSNDQELPYTGNPLFIADGSSFGYEEGVDDVILQHVDYFSRIVVAGTSTSGETFIYIGKKNGKICKLSLNMSSSEPTITEYNGQKIKDIVGTDIFYILNIITDSDIEQYFIFKVGKNLYKYNIAEDFIDENIILWAILPEDINNLSFGKTNNIQNIGNEYGTLENIFLTDIDNHKYYTATFTDTAPVEDAALITFKKKDGTSKSYNAIKFIKKDGTSKTYTKVRFNKINGGD